MDTIDISTKQKKIDRNARKIYRLSLFGFGLLTCGLVSGIVAPTVIACRDYGDKIKDGTDFTDQQYITIPLSLPDSENDKKNVTAHVETIAKKFSAWLKYKKISNYDVWYDVRKAKGQDSSLSASISFTLPQEKIDSLYKSDPEHHQIDNDIYFQLFNTFRTNNKFFLYRHSEELKGEAKYVNYILPFRDVFETEYSKANWDVLPFKPKSKKTSDDYGLSIKLANSSGTVKGTSSKLLDLNLPDIVKNFQIEKSKEDVENKSQLLIINDINSLINEGNYHLIHWGCNNKGTDPEYLRLLSSSDSRSKFAEEYIAKDDETKCLKAATVVAKTSNYEVPSEIEPDWTSNGYAKRQLNGADIFNVLVNDKSEVRYDWTKKYVEKVITSGNYEDFFVKQIDDNHQNNIVDQRSASITDPTETKINYFWYAFDTKNLATTYLENLKEYGFALNSLVYETQLFDFPKEKGDDQFQDNLKRINQTFSHSIVQSSINSSIFGGQKFIIYICLGLMVYLVLLGFFLIGYYRVTGLFSWLSLLFGLSLTTFVTLFGLKVFSLPFIFGISAITLVGTLMSLILCSRIKKKIQDNHDVNAAVIKTIKDSFLSLCDMVIFTLLFGICFGYILVVNNAFGITLIIGSIMSFVSLVLVNFAMLYLFFNNQCVFNKCWLIGKGSNIVQETYDRLYNNHSQQATSIIDSYQRFTCPYFCKKVLHSKFDLFSKKIIYVLISLLVVFLVLLVLFFIFATKQNIFSSSFLIISEKDLSKYNLHYQLCQRYNDMYYYYFASVPKDDVLQKITDEISDARLLDLATTANFDRFIFGIVSIVVGMLMFILYAMVRVNWTIFLPLFASFILSISLTVFVTFLISLKFDQYSIYFLSFSMMTNSLFSYHILSVINQTWYRKEIYSSPEWKYLINITIKNMAGLIWQWIVINLVFVAMMEIFFPTNILIDSLTLYIGLIFSLVLSLIVAPWLLFQMLARRSKIVIHNIEVHKNRIKKNYDDIDEQLIYGINYFHVPPKQNE